MIPHMNRIYISGPMTGHKDFNFPAFDEAEKALRELGWDPISPAQLDRDIGFDPASSVVDEDFLDAALDRDVEAIKNADAIVMLPGWEKSTGANAEMWVARWRKLPVYLYPSMRIMSDAFPVSDAEKPVSDPKAGAGAAKCPMQLLPPAALEHTAWVQGLGASKYGPYNWRDSGVSVSTYIGAIMRHLMAIASGQWLDPESGRPHAAHIAASCNILMDADAHGKMNYDV